MGGTQWEARGGAGREHQNHSLSHCKLLWQTLSYNSHLFLPSLPHQQPQCPNVRDEDVIQLQEMFPSLDKEVVHSVLAETSDGQVDSAIAKLLQMTQ